MMPMLMVLVLARIADSKYEAKSVAKTVVVGLGDIGVKIVAALDLYLLLDKLQEC